jgi:uncharacterized protein YndB with AHSA1/START domain
MKAFESKIRIAAPADRVWSLLTDAAGYPSWNTTVTGIDGQIVLGGKITVHAKINPGRAFPVTVSELVPDERMVWSGGMPLGLFKGVRTFTLTPDGGAIVFHMREVYSGLMSPLIVKSIPDLQPAFDEFAAALKTRAERA